MKYANAVFFTEIVLKASAYSQSIPLRNEFRLHGGQSAFHFCVSSDCFSVVLSSGSHLFDPINVSVR